MRLKREERVRDIKKCNWMASRINERRGEGRGREGK